MFVIPEVVVNVSPIIFTRLKKFISPFIVTISVSLLPKVTSPLSIVSPETVNDPLVEYRQVRNFSIQTKDDALTIDGENYGKTPIDVSVLHKSLKLFADL